MADKYISKQAFNDAIHEAVRKYPNTFYNGLEVARQIAHDMDAADVVPVRHGRWVLKTFDDGYGEYQLYECDQCGAHTAQKCRNFCHNCGAKMDKEVDDGNT